MTQNATPEGPHRHGRRCAVADWSYSGKAQVAVHSDRGRLPRQVQELLGDRPQVRTPGAGPGPDPLVGEAFDHCGHLAEASEDERVTSGGGEALFVGQQPQVPPAAGAPGEACPRVMGPTAGPRAPRPAAAFATAELFTKGEATRVEACGGDGCGWLFLNRSGRRST